MLSKKKKTARWDEGSICKGEGERETSEHASLCSSNLLQGEKRCSWKEEGAGGAPLSSSTARKRQRQVVLLQGGSRTFLPWVE